MRPFKKLKGTSKDNDEYCLENNRRPFVFNITTSDGGTIEYQANVDVSKVPRLIEIFKELSEMAKDE